MPEFPPIIVIVVTAWVMYEVARWPNYRGLKISLLVGLGYFVILYGMTMAGIFTILIRQTLLRFGLTVLFIILGIVFHAMRQTQKDCM